MLANQKAETASEIVCLGYPLGVDSLNHTFGKLSEYSELNGINYIRFDCNINPGNSGGPVIDCNSGKVIGISTLIMKDPFGIGSGLKYGISSIEAINWLKSISVI